MEGLLQSKLPEWALITIACAALLLNILFALGVLRDAHRLHDKDRGPMFVGPNVWFFGVLFGSFLMLALYWLIHHSSLRGTTSGSAPGASA